MYGLPGNIGELGTTVGQAMGAGAGLLGPWLCTGPDPLEDHVNNSADPLVLPSGALAHMSSLLRWAQ